MAPVPTALTIAGSDSGGGAGIQADLKAFARCRVHGTSAITAVTAQNTVGVDAVAAIPAEVIIAQVRSVAADFALGAVKVGMLGDVATTEAVAVALGELDAAVPVVVDPVMVAESGAVLLEPPARAALVELILPRAIVVTPNLAEARELCGAGGSEAEPAELARGVLALGPAAVIVTGGHTETGADTLLSGDGEPIEIGGERFPDGASHGSGCTHSAAVAAMLARGGSLEEAARAARRIAGEAVRDGLRELGAGAGPVDALGVRGRGG